MAEYGDYKKEIKTLGDLRTFVNETLKGIEDDYTFDIDDGFMGIDIILTANCDVSYSSKSFYWTANVNYATEIEKVVDDRIKAKRKIKALEIIKELLYKYCKIELVSGGTYYQITIRIVGSGYSFGMYISKEEFNLLKEMLE